MPINWNGKEKKTEMPDNRYGYNSSGAADPTRTKAEENLAKDEKRIGELVHVLRYVADGAGFDICGRITLRDKETGQVFK